MPVTLARILPACNFREDLVCVVANFLGLAGAALAAGVLDRRPAPRRRTGLRKPVKLILPYAPGGATDLIGRPWAEKLSQAFGQQFIIENRGGAGGMIGTEAACQGGARRLHLPAHAQCDR